MSDTQHIGKYLWKEWIHLCYIHVCSLVGPTRTLVSESVQILAANVISEPFGWVQLVKWHSKAASPCPVLLYSLCPQVSSSFPVGTWDHKWKRLSIAQLVSRSQAENLNPVLTASLREPKGTAFDLRAIHPLDLISRVRPSDTCPLKNTAGFAFSRPQGHLTNCYYQRELILLEKPQQPLYLAG